MRSILHFDSRCRTAVVASVAGWTFLSATLPCHADHSQQAAARFRQTVRPILETYCYGCHGFGAKEGGRAFDDFKSDAALVSDVSLWHAVLKNVRAGVMPLPDEPKPTADEKKKLFAWIERDVFQTDPQNPDPGRITLRRLNRVEYRNTVLDLTGIDFDASAEFPADDSGYGFDNIGDALSMSPLVMEKYLNAARTIVGKMREGEESNGKSERKRRERAIFRRTFGEDSPPDDPTIRKERAGEILSAFVRRAYRRPADKSTVTRLVEMAMAVDGAPQQSFVDGVSAALTAVLASPRFLFRIEEPAADAPAALHPLVDEFTLASRLSYFLWSTMPDDALLDLAERGQLRRDLTNQIDRMLKDERSQALATNFAGQWLRSRDIEHVDIDPIGALGLQAEMDELQQELSRLRREREGRRRPDRDQADRDRERERERSTPEGELRWQERERLRAEFRRLRETGGMFDGELRRAMRDETQMFFNFVVRENRSVLELIDSDYTFLNERLAKHYGMEDVVGPEMRRVELPPDSSRGGVLTQATLLAATSNPSRTSPVKRGLFVLENILGSPPPPPPPPDVPQLEMAETGIKDRQPTVRELMEQHRREPLCHACHARMDPLGLALENFNALGMWRDKENGQPIDASGTLLTGEEFNGINELKAIIRDQHRSDFYRCLTEKFLTYALGRGLEYYDEYTVDRIVDRLDREQGKFSALLTGIIESVPFQRQRRPNVVATPSTRARGAVTETTEAALTPPNSTGE